MAGANKIVIKQQPGNHRYDIFRPMALRHYFSVILLTIKFYKNKILIIIRPFPYLVNQLTITGTYSLLLEDSAPFQPVLDLMQQSLPVMPTAIA